MIALRPCFPFCDWINIFGGQWKGKGPTVGYDTAALRMKQLKKVTILGFYAAAYHLNTLLWKIFNTYLLHALWSFGPFLVFKRSGMYFTPILFSPVNLCFLGPSGGVFASIVALDKGNQSNLFLFFFNKGNYSLYLWELILLSGVSGSRVFI